MACLPWGIPCHSRVTGRFRCWLCDTYCSTTLYKTSSYHLSSTSRSAHRQNTACSNSNTTISNSPAFLEPMLPQLAACLEYVSLTPQMSLSWSRLMAKSTLHPYWKLYVDCATRLVLRENDCGIRLRRSCRFWERTVELRVAPRSYCWIGLMGLRRRGCPRLLDSLCYCLSLGGCPGVTEELTCPFTFVSLLSS